jgi:hypothetical protein
MLNMVLGGKTNAWGEAKRNPPARPKQSVFSTPKRKAADFRE